MSAAAAVAAAGLAAPAWAHVEVSADKTTAGAENVTLKFNGEAEDPAAGIQSERVVLPEGITPASVSLVAAPSGWSFTRNADGFTVAGKALAKGTDAVWKVKIAKLPAGVTRLNFKTLETYGNGDVARWIELRQAGQPEPENPAPLVTLKPGSAAAPAPSIAVSTVPALTTPDSAPPTSEPAIAPATITTVAAADTKSNSNSLWWLWVVGAALVLFGLVLWQVRRRAAANNAD